MLLRLVEEQVCRGVPDDAVTKDGMPNIIPTGTSL